MSTESTPPSSRPRSRASRKSLTIDLSSLPPPNLPTPPSNTLIITNLYNPLVFSVSSLQEIKTIINNAAPIHSWAPLKSFHRIIVSFMDIDAATLIRRLLDGKIIMGDKVRVYFGQSTSIEPKEEHLNLPDAGKLFFISPPPSPPHGWSAKLEDAPNKQVMAEDLVEALSKLHAGSGPCFPDSPISDQCRTTEVRTRSGSSTTIYRPEEHGCSPNLPAINVEDTTGDNSEISPIEEEKPIFAHTFRPPVELMQVGE
ncbi:Calcipressin family protein [Blumeria hordei DH14]|nr:Calcipressin family protein [Blumeria hordei DH14]